MKTVKYKDKTYPHFQSEGNAAQFAIPFAKHFCFGHGADVGCSNKDWAFPGAIPVDLEFEDEWHANNLPRELDYIFSERRRIRSHYLDAFAQFEWAEITPYNPDVLPWLINLRIIDSPRSFTYEELQTYLKFCSIDSRPMFQPFHSFSYLKEYVHPNMDYSSSSIFSNSALSLPTYIGLSMDDIRYVASSVSNFISL